MNTNPSNLIRNAKFFSELSEAACSKLARMSRQKNLEKRDFLFMEGSKGDAVYLLVSGSIQLIKTNLDGKETVIKTVKTGELFAELVLFEKNRYPVTATAVTRAEVIELPKAGFLNLLDEREFRNEFMAMLMTKQRYLTERIQQLTSMDAEERFIEFLREQYGEREMITLNLPKKDIAAAIDTTPETFSRLLHKLEARGVFSWNGKTIRVAPAFWEVGL